MPSSTRATSLTRQLLAFSRRQVMQPRVLDVNAVVIEMEHLTWVNCLDKPIHELQVRAIQRSAKSAQSLKNSASNETFLVEATSKFLTSC